MKDKLPTDKAKKAGGAPDPKASEAKVHDGSNPFDIWLSRKLGDMFDQVAHEPLPKELLDLVNKLEQKEKSAADPAADEKQTPKTSPGGSKAH